MNVGTISGGTQPNIVPDSCVIEIDRRTLPGETENRRPPRNRRAAAGEKIVRKNFQHQARAGAAAGNGREIAVGATISYAASARRDRMGVDYFCDAAVLAAGGIPSVVFGPGDIAQAHTADEWISLAELERGKNRLLNFLKSLS